MRLPIKYSKSSPAVRRRARNQYVEDQYGRCYHCNSDLFEKPPAEITSKKIRWSAFPKNFLKWPVHLHHCHDTDDSIGAVHAYCNAVLWQYHGE